MPQAFSDLLSLRFSWRFLLAFCSLFMIEVLIAVFIHDDFIRPFIGDMLVILLMYSFVGIFLKGPTNWICAALLLFAYLVEGAQALRLVERLGLQDNTLARIVIGTTFDWKDLLAYTVGAALIVLYSRSVPGQRDLGDNDQLNSSESAGPDL